MALFSFFPFIFLFRYKTTFALWTLTQSPLIVATDVRNMTSVMNMTLLNKEMIDLHQSTHTVPGKRLAVWDCKEPLSCEIWGRKLPPAPQSTDGWIVALVNRGKDEHSITVKWQDLGLESQTTASVHNVWTGEFVGNATRSWSDKVPTHGTVLVRIETVSVQR